MMIARTITPPRTYHHILGPPALAIGVPAGGVAAGGGGDCVGVGVGAGAAGCSIVGVVVV
jgi:hypothetical protein